MSAPECIVFVIDDDPLVRESVADLLNSVGFTVQPFGSATEFVQSERPEVSACLILDVDYLCLRCASVQDIAPLTEFFVAKFAGLNKPIDLIPDDAMAVLKARLAM